MFGNYRFTTIFILFFTASLAANVAILVLSLLLVPSLSLNHPESLQSNTHIMHLQMACTVGDVLIHRRNCKFLSEGSFI